MVLTGVFRSYKEMSKGVISHDEIGVQEKPVIIAGRETDPDERIDLDLRIEVGLQCTSALKLYELANSELSSCLISKSDKLFMERGE